MARISGPADMEMPFIIIEGKVEIFLPVDVPEGGELQIVCGTSPLAPPLLRAEMIRGVMVAMFSPETIAREMPRLVVDTAAKAAQLVRLDRFSVHGVPIDAPHWLPAGGFLNVRVGADKNAPPVPSTPVREGSLIGFLPPEVAQIFRAGIHKSEQQRAAHNPFAIVPKNGAAG